MSSTTDAGVTAPPDWFIAALGTPVEQRTVTVDGVPIAYRGWGKPGPDGIVLVHGGGAHSRWWDHIAPLLAGERRVAAIDLSGHGDSGRRQCYGLDDWAREVLAVAEDDQCSADRGWAQHGRVCDPAACEHVRVPAPGRGHD